MGEHCHSHDKIDPLIKGAKSVLIICLAVNFTMFLVEVTASFFSGSISLLADSIDFLSDSFAYAITLYALDKSVKTKVKVSNLKAILMLVIAAVVLYSGINSAFFSGETPEHTTMGIVGSASLAANVFCAWLLFRFRTSESNLRSVWLCSRNDAINNIAIIIAAFFVFFTESRWPDLIVALFITLIETHSAIQIFRQTKIELKDAK